MKDGQANDDVEGHARQLYEIYRSLGHGLGPSLADVLNGTTIPTWEAIAGEIAGDRWRAVARADLGRKESSFPAEERAIKQISEAADAIHTVASSLRDLGDGDLARARRMLFTILGRRMMELLFKAVEGLDGALLGHLQTIRTLDMARAAVVVRMFQALGELLTRIGGRTPPTEDGPA